MTDEIKRLRHSKNEADRRKALALLSDYLRANPDSAEGWYDKAGCHDFIGEESEAEPCYQKTYLLGWRKLPEQERKSFFVGYGSTLRNNLKFDESERILREAVTEFPECPTLQVFLAFTLYSKHEHAAAAQVLFLSAPLIAKHGLDGYERAIQWYAENLETHPKVES